jgi:hypothetical protein
MAVHRSPHHIALQTTTRNSLRGETSDAGRNPIPTTTSRAKPHVTMTRANPVKIMNQSVSQPSVLVKY